MQLLVGSRFAEPVGIGSSAVFGKSGRRLVGPWNPFSGYPLFRTVADFSTAECSVRDIKRGMDSDLGSDKCAAARHQLRAHRKPLMRQKDMA